MTKVILIHGNGGGTGRDNWFPYLKKELNKIDIQCEAPDFPDSKLARAKFWLPFLKKLKADQNTILVGHSSGAIAALRYAENNKLLGSVLVGVYHTDLDDEGEKQSGYFDIPWQWAKIKNSQRWIAVYASKDDPYIPIKEPRFIKEKLAAEYFEFDDEGHFGSDKNKITFPEILKFLKSKLNK